MSTGNIIEEMKLNATHELKFKQLDPNAKLPTYGSAGATGMDLYACSFDGYPQLEFAIDPGENAMIGTGIAVELPLNHSGLVLPRSGLASKKGLRPANTPGLVDPDYRGEIKVCLHNDSKDTQIIQLGERIAQFLVAYTPTYQPVFVSELSDTERGDKGFGSTGSN